MKCTERVVVTAVIYMTMTPNEETEVQIKERLESALEKFVFSDQVNGKDDVEAQVATWRTEVLVDRVK